MAVAFVNKDDCTGCEACVGSCPTEAIIMEGDVAFVKEDECTGCEACVSECPVEAIVMKD